MLSPVSQDTTMNLGNNPGAGAANGNPTTESEGNARANAAASLASQTELVEVNREFMVAMAWLNFALSVSSKINGR